MAVLTFTEIVNTYRTIELISLDFSPSDWAVVKADVTRITSALSV